MARALLNFGFFKYRLPHHGSKILQKNYIHIETLENRGRSGPQVTQLFFAVPGHVLGQHNNDTCVVELLLFGCFIHR